MQIHTTETSDDARAEAPPVRPTLRVLHSGTSAIEVRAPIPLQPGENIAGREPESNRWLPLPDDRRLSRRHTTFVVDDRGTVRARDDGSKNGTFVNGARVGERALADGDVVRAGDTFLIFRAEPERRSDTAIPSIVGVSRAASELRHALAVAAPSTATVLLLGESGTGKEVAAHAIHERSGRAGPIVVVNCGAIPEQLAESQLFGHVAGAFTGAHAASPGFFRAAHGGTLFLDEVGELPVNLQPKLLRALEEKKVVPVGTTTAVPCDVRVVAATNRDLGRAILDHAFRGDLYARLAEVVLRIPPLSARREDVLPLLARALGPPAPRLTARLVNAILHHPWPFNVREVFKVASQLRLYSRDGMSLDVEAIADRLTAPEREDGAKPAEEPGEPAAEESRADRAPVPTREQLVEMLAARQGNVSHVAQAVGRSRRQIQRWMEQHGLDPAAFRRREGGSS